MGIDEPHQLGHLKKPDIGPDRPAEVLKSRRPQILVKSTLW